MCGICGAVNRGSRVVDESHIRAMVAILRHRGPDDGRVLSAGPVLLGHSRLSIIDLAGGAQPMPSHDGRLWVVFNGEIFNYLELRAELEGLGHEFRTQSDTEVILEAFREWGTDCFRRFNGQWALAIWEPAADRLVISRDRVGIRPLYYTSVRGSFLFASEVKALFCHPEVERAFDPAGLAESFTFWSPVAPRTAFAGVRQLPPGTYAVVRASDASLNEPTSYWSPEFGRDANVRSASVDENAERLRSLLIDAAQLRFSRSDVPVGAYLSGGIDSTVTTAVLAEYTSTPLETFSVAFADSEFDESSYQALVADRLGTAHHRITIEAGDIGEVFPEVVWHGEQPILRTAPAPLYLLSGLVRENGCKVVVTGEGSDEMLAGYDIFREAVVRRAFAADPKSQRAEQLLRRLYPWMERSPARAPAFAKAFFSQRADLDDPALSHRPRWAASGALLRMLVPQFEAPSGDDVASELLSGLPSVFGQWHPLEQAQFLEMRTLLSGYILAPQGDRMLMGHSVEGRFPFLDHRVIALAASLPPEQKLTRELDEKHILKRAFADLIPAEVLRRPKQPYRAPDAASFFATGADSDWLPDLLSESALRSAGVFSPAVIQGLLKKCRSRDGQGMSNTDNMRIVGAVSTMLLHSQFIGGDSAFARARRDGECIPVERLEHTGIHAGS